MEVNGAHLGGLALAGVRATEVVYDDIGTSRGEEGSICLSKTTAGAGDDDGLVIES